MNNVLVNLSIVKTLRFNMRYFGFKGIVKPRVILSRNVKLVHLGGSVNVDESRGAGYVYLGFKVSGIADIKNERFFWDNKGIVTFRGGYS